MKKSKIILIIVVILTLAIFGIFYKKIFIYNHTLPEMKLTSSAFSNNGQIPLKYACEGDDVNPHLKITDIPEQAKSLAIIVDDPDAPFGTWVHWVVFNIPVSGNELEIQEAQKPQGIEGVNDFGKTEYNGPCPPSGTHRYFFKAYSLNSELDLKKGATKKEVEKAMEKHVVASAELIGLYGKK